MTDAPAPASADDAARPDSVLVVGGGVAGFAAVRELRRRGYAGELTLVEPQGLPYDRPPLSKEYLTGASDARHLLFAGPEWYREHGVSVIADRADALDLSVPTPRVRLASGTDLAADVVVLATGSRPRALGVPGGDDPALHRLHTRADADRLAAAWGPGRRVVVIGGGFTGAEVASAAREAFADVTLVAAGAPGAGAFGPVLAERLHRLHAERGVGLVDGTVTAVEPDGGDGHVVRVRLADGQEQAVAADVVVVAVGADPDTALAEAAGLEVAGGVLVDQAGRTSDPRVRAVGDVARRRGAAERADRHWEAAVHGGEDVAAALTGQDPAERGVGWFWSDRHGAHVEVVGALAPPPGGRTVERRVRGDVVAAFALDEAGHVVGAATLDDPASVKAARRLIDRRVVVDPERLADPAVPVRALLRG